MPNAIPQSLDQSKPTRGLSPRLNEPISLLFISYSSPTAIVIRTVIPTTSKSLLLPKGKPIDQLCHQLQFNCVTD